MANLRPRIFCALSVAALGAGGLAASCSASAESASRKSAPVVLDYRVASKLLSNKVKPEYPPLAKINFIQGHVRLQVWVSREGRVMEAHIVYGHPLLAASALKTVRRWAYEPYKSQFGPTEFTTFVDMNFALHIRKIEQVPPSAELDLTRRVQPPEVLSRPPGQASASLVHLHVLVGEDGQPLDASSANLSLARYLAARKSLQGWTFQPARWGKLPVPWYLDVDVPVEDDPPPPETRPASKQP